MKGSTTVKQSAKFKEILKERNGIIEYYKEKSDGLTELCDLMKCLIYALLINNKSSTVSKKDISGGVGKNLINLIEDEENYYISVFDPADVVKSSESYEEEKI